jgi:DNA-binding XRE family transcriptional regulator
MGESKLDCSKVGALLFRLRKEKGLTQKQVADRMNLSDKTVSKWERGLGCPDVSLLGELSNLFEINIEKILNGNLEPNALDSGNFRCLKFYVCPACGNVITSTGNAEISCCGRRLSPLTAKPADNEHRATVEDADGESYVTFHHEMKKRPLYLLCCVCHKREAPVGKTLPGTGSFRKDAQNRPATTQIQHKVLLLLQQTWIIYLIKILRR